MEQDKILKHMSVPRAMTKIGLPAIASTLIMAIYNLVDTFFIGMLHDDKALAAIAVAFPIMNLISAIGQMIGAGSASAIGRAFGAKKDKFADEIASTAVFSAFISGTLFMLCGIAFIEPIFRLFGTTNAVMPRAVEYGVWMYIGAFFSIPNQSFNNIARAETKATLSMKTLMFGAILNVFLDPIFMFDLGGFGLNMGIRGASIATTVAQIGSFIYIGSYFFRDKMRVKIRLKSFKPCKLIYGEIGKSGVPTGLIQLLSTVAVSVTNLAIVNAASTELIAENLQSAYGLVLKIMVICQQAAIGYFMGYQPIAAYAYGAKDKERFRECFTWARKVMLCLAVPVTLVPLIFAPALVDIFTDSAVIIGYGTKFLRLNVIFYVLVGLSSLFTMTFQAAGHGKMGVIIAVARQGLIYIPLIILLSTRVGVEGIYYAQPIADVLTFAVGIMLYSKFTEKTDKYFLESEESITA